MIDGDREGQLGRAAGESEQADNGTLVAEIHGKIETIGGYTINSRAAELLMALVFAKNK